MPSKAKSVTEYMREIPLERLDTLTELREICLQNLRGFKESMEFGMPSYSRDGQIEVAWTSQKEHLTVYIYNEQVFKKLKQQLKGYETGKNWIRLKKIGSLDFQMISQLLTEVVNTPYEVLV